MDAELPDRSRPTKPAPGDAADQFAQEMASLWRLPQAGSATGNLVASLVHCARLAANSHNSQPWRFRESDRGIDLIPDFSRRLPAVDPDDHHLYASLGCAAENLCLAAYALGRVPELSFDAERITIALAPIVPQSTARFAAIAQRRTSRSAYDGSQLSTAALTQLERAVHSSGVDCLMIADRQRIDTVLEFALAANTAQLRDRAFVAELRSWIRFNTAAALDSSDGLASACFGNPDLPTWLGRMAFPLLLRPASENRRLAAHIRSASAMVVISAHRDNPAGWFEAGRAAQRFQLEATVLGLQTAWINQPVESPASRASFARAMGLSDQRPDLVLRVGRGPQMPHSARRPVSSILSCRAQRARR